jgi:hypothetical protein
MVIFSMVSMMMVRMHFIVSIHTTTYLLIKILSMVSRMTVKMNVIILLHTIPHL